MDQAMFTSDSVLELLLKTNRPPTDQETAIIQESIANTNAKLKTVETQISATVAHIQELKLQVEQAEIKLQRLREEEAAILETFAGHRRVFSPFRHVPEDVLREICIACVEGEIPKLYYLGSTPLPYTLAQISIGLRNIALTTPRIWASMKILIDAFHCYNPEEYDRAYLILAQKARKWFERAGSLALTVSIVDTSSTYAILDLESSEYGQLNILLDTLLSYSTRWKELQFDSWCRVPCISMIHIAALTAVDVPLLQSVTLRLDCLNSNTVFSDSEFHTIPSLRHVTLQTPHAVQMFTINWAVLTSITLRGMYHTNRCYSKSAIARILHQTKCLVSCDIVVGLHNSEEHYHTEIGLPFLKTLILDEFPSERTSSGGPSILDLIIAPFLEICDLRHIFLNLSLSDFFKRSPRIQELSLPCLQDDTSLSVMTKLLRQCPLLTLPAFIC
ncbi:hypothetical protein HYPSUDRAFT_275493 [Hypholoma sublateritium FD-334 SS-4]|uniref:F-box domain-containing protein n=1 Tax=Hypholoma sublateritium (strain FD-334 SS-4) TaxID=945553 RepID=A0A0D2LFR6_HYPSF|nr:hypothetical protein HYPSUDRAFT_275493 [Hypholoma sublateritium FD-334 SS-4]